jgi:Na+/phosphate symporter
MKKNFYYFIALAAALFFAVNAMGQSSDVAIAAAEERIDLARQKFETQVRESERQIAASRANIAAYKLQVEKEKIAQTNIKNVIKNKQSTIKL